jgi:hypothetical protein
MERLKNAGLVFCLFVVLVVILSSCFRASGTSTLFGALAGTPLLVHLFNRLVVPARELRERTRSTTEVISCGERLTVPTEQVFVLRLERPDGRPSD